MSRCILWILFVYWVRCAVFFLLCVIEVNSVRQRLAASVDWPECRTWNSYHARLVCCISVATRWPALGEFTKGQWRHPTA